MRATPTAAVALVGVVGCALSANVDLAPGRELDRDGLWLGIDHGVTATDSDTALHVGDLVNRAANRGIADDLAAPVRSAASRLGRTDIHDPGAEGSLLGRPTMGSSDLDLSGVAVIFGIRLHPNNVDRPNQPGGEELSHFCLRCNEPLANEQTFFNYIIYMHKNQGYKSIPKIRLCFSYQ